MTDLVGSRLAYREHKRVLPVWRVAGTYVRGSHEISKEICQWQIMPIQIACGPPV